MDGQHMVTTPNYSDNNVGWEKGQAYQSWVRQMYPCVYNGGQKRRELTYLEGKQEQLQGETLEGVEVKFDDKMRDTKRIYIEMYEKSRGENEKYVESGIYRNDNTKFILIGDYYYWFLFSKARLVWLDRNDPPFLYRPKPTDTSIGFCIPIENAQKLCLDYREFNGDTFQPPKSIEEYSEDESWLDGIRIAKNQ